MADELPPMKRGMTVWLYDELQRLYSAAPYRAFKSGRAFPAWHYFFEVTRRCNLRCRMCQYLDYLQSASAAQQKAGELSAEEWKGVVDATARLSIITFTGGEPLVRDDFMEIFSYASAKRRTHIVTNATLLKAPIAQALVDLAPRRLGARGFNFAGVSLEGPAEKHDYIRQQVGAFERASAGIRMLHDLRMRSGKKCPLIHVTTVLQQANVDTLEHMPEIVATLGGDVLNLVTETRMHDLQGLGERPPGTWRASDVQWPRIERAALQDALEKTVAQARKRNIEVRLPRMPREDLLRYYESGVDVKEYACYSPWNTVIIGRTGDVYPCWLIKLGNVRDQSLKSMWNGEKAKAFRQACRSRLFPLCPGCCFIEYRGTGGDSTD